MIRLVLAFVLAASGVWAEVRVDPARSVIRDGWWSLRVELGLSDIVPYRVFTLDQPRRLVLDFEGLDWANIAPDQMLEPGRATGLRFGALRPGWSRMVVDLDAPLAVTQAGMFSSDAGADLTVVLERVSAAEFAAKAGPPPDAGGAGLVSQVPDIAPADDTFVVVLDPGHGGIDPGANRDGVQEAEIMLDLAQEIAAALAQTGIRVELTRDTDNFVPLSARLTTARAAGADLFISLHADALDKDLAQGASVYTLARDGGDRAARRLVERHERGDLLAGVDLEGTEDRVANVLLDMARAKTGPAGQRFASDLVQQMRDRGVRLNARPLRQGRFVVLGAADFPAVLIEAGFLSNAQDRATLSTPQGRGPLVAAVAGAIRALAAQDAP
ncbi:N-acetylmuramoyl-L-alanine amidase [Loktanella agnita]|uniref:N-acetylmuramoyl-L-alanine amidase n=1 Tax=Loktanella agnita TaxID=287097 RepID=UPI0039882942